MRLTYFKLAGSAICNGGTNEVQTICYSQTDLAISMLGKVKPFLSICLLDFVGNYLGI